MTIGERLRRGVSFGDMALALLFVGFATRALTMSASADTYWHLRTGADILRTGSVPRVDAYSFTAAGWPWRNHEWLWDPFSYACFRLGGMPLSTGTAGFDGWIPAARVYELQQLLPSLTRGEGVLESAFDHYREVRGAVPERARLDHNPLNRKEYLLRLRRRV